MSKFLLFFCILFTVCSSSLAQSCANYTFAGNEVFGACNDLPYLNSYIHWTYNSSSQTAEIAYRHTGVSSSSWVAWAINPSSQGMLGAQAIIAFQNSDGTMRAYTSPLTSYGTRLQEGALSFNVSDLRATYSNNEVIIFAKLGLQNHNSTLNHVWQEGPVSNGNPGMHSISGPNMRCMGTLNLLSGEAKITTSGAVDSRSRRKNIHGSLNVASWGILMFVGALLARYLKLFPSAGPTWFYLHVACQLSGYVLGVSGWATGLQLGRKSQGIQYTAHLIIGTLIVCHAMIQVMTALFIRPKPDHKYRYLWNIYHRSVGISIIILGMANIFIGFKILNPEKIWRNAYIGVVVAMVVVAIILELCLKMRKNTSETDEKEPSRASARNGLNRGYNIGAEVMV